MKKKELRNFKKLTTSTIKSEFENLDFTIFLVQPQGPINIGLIARVMKNFGVQNLLIFHPECKISSVARKFSMHGLDLLQKARIINDNSQNKSDRLKSLKNIFDEFDYVIGTSSKKTRYGNVKRTTYYVNELDFTLFKSSHGKIAVVFGREDKGLFNAELKLCDFVIKIPVTDDYPALNLSHAVTITLSQFFLKTRIVQKGDIITSTRSNREFLYREVEKILNTLNYEKNAKDDVIQALKNILGRSFSSLKEVNLLISLFSAINKKKK
ncbi:MAG: hypothetical protein JW776_01985 [Candidatus Lokiarchaeota archaeon]|nr:hypothetical protein [Candidatus Lokiarchaeota archaeon]